MNENLNLKRNEIRIFKRKKKEIRIFNTGIKKRRKSSDLGLKIQLRG